MIHIVHNAGDVDVLKEAIALDESLAGEVLQVKDDYAVGPLHDIFTEEGIKNRNNWWREVLAGGDYDGQVDKNIVDDPALMSRIKEMLNADAEEQLWIWVAPNKHDVCSYYWLIGQLAEFVGRVYILHLNNLPFLNEKGHVFYPNWLMEIPPKEFLKAKKLARLVTISEFEIDSDEWNKLCSQESGIRLLDGAKKLVLEPVNSYDSDLRRFVMPQWQKAIKVIHNYQHKGKHQTGDMFLLWRLKELIKQDLFDVQGEVKHMKDFELKTKGAAAPENQEA